MFVDDGIATARASLLAALCPRSGNSNGSRNRERDSDREFGDNGNQRKDTELNKTGFQIPAHYLQQISYGISHPVNTNTGSNSNDTANKRSGRYGGSGFNSNNGASGSSTSDTASQGFFYDVNNADYRIINSSEILEVLSGVPLQANVEYFDVSSGKVMFAGIGMDERVESSTLLQYA
jgi:hypothetical protein